jgi:hypothetical protein
MKNQFRAVTFGVLMSAGALSFAARAAEPAAGDPYQLRVAHAADVGVGDVLLTWTDAPAGKKAYKLYRQGSDGAWTDLATLPPGSAEYQDDGLSATSRYVYRLVITSHEMPETGILTSKDQPQKVSMPLAGARELVLLTTIGGDNDFNDHSTWCMPVLVKEDGTAVRLLEALKPTSAQVGWGNPGTAEDKPWKSLARVNSVVLAAGDKVLIKAGSAYNGCLKLQGSGKEGAPIVVDKYSPAACGTSIDKPSAPPARRHVVGAGLACILVFARPRRGTMPRNARLCLLLLTLLAYGCSEAPQDKLEQLKSAASDCAGQAAEKLHDSSGVPVDKIKGLAAAIDEQDIERVKAVCSEWDAFLGADAMAAYYRAFAIEAQSGPAATREHLAEQLADPGLSEQNRRALEALDAFFEAKGTISTKDAALIVLGIALEIKFRHGTSKLVKPFMDNPDGTKADASR